MPSQPRLCCKDCCLCSLLALSLSRRFLKRSLRCSGVLCLTAGSLALSSSLKLSLFVTCHRFGACGWRSRRSLLGTHCCQWRRGLLGTLFRTSTYHEGNIAKIAILEQNVAVVLTTQTLHPETLHAALVLNVWSGARVTDVPLYIHTYIHINTARIGLHVYVGLAQARPKYTMCEIIQDGYQFYSPE